MSCNEYKAEEWVGYLTEDHSGEKQNAMRQHLGQCGDCREVLQEFQGLRKNLENWKHNLPSSFPERQSREIQDLIQRKMGSSMPDSTHETTETTDREEKDGIYPIGTRVQVAAAMVLVAIAGILFFMLPNQTGNGDGKSVENHTSRNPGSESDTYVQFSEYLEENNSNVRTPSEQSIQYTKEWLLDRIQKSMGESKRSGGGGDFGGKTDPENGDKQEQREIKTELAGLLLQHLKRARISNSFLDHALTENEEMLFLPREKIIKSKVYRNRKDSVNLSLLEQENVFLVSRGKDKTRVLLFDSLQSLRIFLLRLDRFAPVQSRRKMKELLLGWLDLARLFKGKSRSAVFVRSSDIQIKKSEKKISVSGVLYLDRSKEKKQRWLQGTMTFDSEGQLLRLSVETVN